MAGKRAALLICALLCCALMAGLCLAADVEIASYKYPTYLLQAQAWLRGEMKLEYNHEYLELAVYEGEYYVSFPPVPSAPMVLWALIFGNHVPGGLFQKIYVLIACLLVLSEIQRSKKMPMGDGIAWAIFITLASAMLPITMVGAVWYEAQIMAFMFAMAAIVALRRGRATIACLCYALAVGCRPFAALLGPVLLMMYVNQNKGVSFIKGFKKLLPGLAVGLCIAGIYGWYNYIRFGDVFEFGHNYLPEFTRAEHGQLSTVYLWDNLMNFLFGKPFHMEDSALRFNQFGFSLFISCPIFICNLIWIIRDVYLQRFNYAKGVILLMGAVNVILLCMHRTLGGHQFGARYALEMVPLSFCYLLLSEDRQRISIWESALLGFGLIFNFVGGCLIHV